MPILIDWDDLRQGYNERFGKSYANIRDFLSAFYVETKSTNVMADILGVARGAVLRQLRLRDIPIQSRGGDYSKRAYKANGILNVPESELADMDCGQIARRVGCSKKWVWVITRKYGKNINGQFRKKNLYAF